MDQQWTNCYREKGFHASYYFPLSSLCLRLNHIKIHHVHGTTCLFFFRFFRFSLHAILFSSTDEGSVQMNPSVREHSSYEVQFVY